MDNQAAYLNSELSAKERAQDLVSRMTLEEKASQLRYYAAAVERLGVPAYNWWNEALHGVARAGTSTVFPQAIALAAIFDDEYLSEIADIIATEARAKYNAYAGENDRDIYKGLTMWSPNINIFRDPRWGRGHETYGEDPYLTSRLGVAFVRGLQGDGKHLKTAACAKHYAVHSGPEGLRHEFDAVASKKDMFETYLPAFEALVREADVEAVMGAYNRTNGEPCCGSPTLLKEILRDMWEFDGHVVSDCWAIRDFHEHHLVTKNAVESVALALNSGCDLNCGNSYDQLLDAVKQGMISEQQIDLAAVRLMTTRIKLGLFDEVCDYNNIGYEMNDCAAHKIKNLEAARKSIVLLKNDGVLPLNRENIKSIAVIGPTADSKVVLSGNYNGTASRYTTILDGISDAAGDDIRIYYSEGSHLFKDRVEPLAQPDDRISEAVIVAKQSDVVIMCLGLDSTIEGEEGDTGNAYAAGDKLDLNLPVGQRRLLEAVTAVGKPVVVVLTAGSAIDLRYADRSCNAILNAWYPGSRGGQAVADVIFGEVSPSGKLPVTFYNDTADLPDFTDYSMRGRTYRYLKSSCLYPFGYGLTYGKTELSNLQVAGGNVLESGENCEISVAIKNIGACAIEEVVQCYIKDLESEFAVPNHNLCAFKRVKLEPGANKTVSLYVKPQAFTVVDADGVRKIDSNRFRLWVGISQPDARSVELVGGAPLSVEITLKRN
ncbi:MAG: beta-glucosidase [Clostridiales bacterium]|jgi:beta-glucosidase|nr:beta-glucosidase [Clostridiales bacterium]